MILKQSDENHKRMQEKLKKARDLGFNLRKRKIVKKRDDESFKDFIFQIRKESEI